MKYVNITTPEQFCTVYEKCKFLSMGYISAMAQASVNMKQGRSFNVIVKDNNNIFYVVRNGLGGKLS